MLDRVHRIRHPVIRSISYSTLATYSQLYFDGNKRTSRYMMDGELMSNGFDAIAIPASREREYHESLAVLFREADASQHSRFLLDVLRSGDPVDA